jgi:tRNA nucleotidyltransferase (CCA-adding enzyme)
MTPDEYMASLGLPEVYAVGGSVRDQLLGCEGKDSDYLVREASIQQIREAFVAAGAQSVKPLRLRDGREVGVRAAVRGLRLIEVTLPRKEVSTGPGHRDFKIVCDQNLSLADDAIRRDFTINALYRDVKTDDILDPQGGERDIGARIIRTIHPDSFRDDPLRILRALRFVSTLGFNLELRTMLEMATHAGNVSALTLKGVSGTALEELSKLLMGEKPKYAFRLMRETKVLSVFLPELSSMIGFEQKSAYHDKTCDDHTFDAIQIAADHHASLRVRMALLFHDAGKPWMAWMDEDNHKHYYELTPEQIREYNAPPTAMYSHEWWGAFLAEKALTRFNAPADLKGDVLTLIERHMVPLRPVKAIKVRTWRAELGDSLLGDLITHRECDVLGKGDDTEDALYALSRLREEQTWTISQGVPRSTKELTIKGTDLVALGLKGPEIGEVQRELLHEVMAQPKLNDREWLLSRAAKLAKQRRNENAKSPAG